MQKTIKNHTSIFHETSKTTFWALLPPKNPEQDFL